MDELKIGSLVMLKPSSGWVGQKGNPEEDEVALGLVKHIVTGHAMGIRVTWISGCCTGLHNSYPPSDLLIAPVEGDEVLVEGQWATFIEYDYDIEEGVMEFYVRFPDGRSVKYGGMAVEDVRKPPTSDPNTLFLKDTDGYIAGDTEIIRARRSRSGTPQFIIRYAGSGQRTACVTKTDALAVAAALIEIAE